MNVQETILVGIISSVVASMVYYLLMISIKPRFIISDKMSKTVCNGYTDYMIKVVNTTRSVITNINYSLEYCIEGPDGIIEVQNVKPLKSPLLNIDKYTKKNTDYAIRLTYRVKDGDFELKDNTYFEFTFQAYHSFSNSLKIKKKIYKTKSVMDGIFETGKSTKILSRK